MDYPADLPRTQRRPWGPASAGLEEIRLKADATGVFFARRRPILSQALSGLP
jgi:hypothetical protein